MPGRSNRSARVVLCDDVDWSEPTPRGRRTAAELDAPSWMQANEAESPRHEDLERVRGYLDDERVEAGYGDAGEHHDGYEPEAPRSRAGGHSGQRDVEASHVEAGYRVDDYLGEFADGLDLEYPGDQAAAEVPVIDYTDAVDEEQLWGPRPKFLTTESGGRRTVVITGRGSDRYVAPRGGARESLPAYARHGFVADRTAMWAVLLCVIVLLVAITSH